MIDIQALLEQYENSTPVHGLPYYADYWDDGKKIFAPEYGILAIACFDADGSCKILGPNDFEVVDRNCSIIAPGNGSFYIRAVFLPFFQPKSHGIKLCFLLASPYKPLGGMIHFFPLEKMADYPYKD